MLLGLVCAVLCGLSTPLFLHVLITLLLIYALKLDIGQKGDPEVGNNGAGLVGQQHLPPQQQAMLGAEGGAGAAVLGAVAPPPADARELQLVQFEVPAGMGPGMQMQVTHPRTGQVVTVTLPPDAVPGGTVQVMV